MAINSLRLGVVSKPTKKDFLEELLDCDLAKEDLVYKDNVFCGSARDRFIEAVSKLDTTKLKIGDKIGDYTVIDSAYIKSNYSYQRCPECTELTAVNKDAEVKAAIKSGAKIVIGCDWCGAEFKFN